MYKQYFILISAESCMHCFLFSTELGIIHPSLQGYGFPVNQLFDMLLEMRDQYGEILLKKWNQSFRCFLPLLFSLSFLCFLHLDASVFHLSKDNDDLVITLWPLRNPYWRNYTNGVMPKCKARSVLIRLCLLYIICSDLQFNTWLPNIHFLWNMHF